MRTIVIAFGLIVTAVTVGNCLGQTIQDQIQPVSQQEEIKISQGE